MATKMKNGLRRFQFYLTEEGYRKFEAELEEFNKGRTEENLPKLSESGFCQLKLTGASPLLRGAPRGNKNACGRRTKPPVDSAESDFSNQTDSRDSLPDNHQTETDNVAQITNDIPTESSPAPGIPDDENTKTNNEPNSINSMPETPGVSAAFENADSPEEVPTKMSDLSGDDSSKADEDRRAEQKAEEEKVARQDLQDISDEEIVELAENIKLKNRGRH